MVRNSVGNKYARTMSVLNILSIKKGRSQGERPGIRGFALITEILVLGQYNPIVWIEYSHSDIGMALQGFRSV